MLQFNTTWVNGEEIILPSRFRVIEPVGQGAFGLVVSAKEELSPTSHRQVAIKKIKNIFSSGAMASRVIREMMVMRNIEHPNLLSMEQVILPTGKHFKEVYIVTNLMETDLASVLKTKQDLSSSQAKLIFYQLTRGLVYLHAMGVIHRDLKPRNILLNSNCDVKICDFGLATGFVADEPKTAYICTRWYRAPELLLGHHTYDMKIDVFSAGCILGEIIGTRPLLPGRSTQDQLKLLAIRFGIPTEKRNYSLAFPKASGPTTPNGDLEEYIGAASVKVQTPDAFLLIRRLCAFDPSHRPSIAAILDDEWFGEFRLAAPDESPKFKFRDIKRVADRREGMKEWIKKQVDISNSIRDGIDRSTMVNFST